MLLFINHLSETIERINLTNKPPRKIHINKHPSTMDPIIMVLNTMVPQSTMVLNITFLNIMFLNIMDLNIKLNITCITPPNITSATSLSIIYME